jgi:hypothetical protein
VVSKAILVCVALISGFTSVAADEVGTSSHAVPKIDAASAAADQACFDAVFQVAINQYDQSVKPLPALAQALVRRCNGHPNKIVCEAVSRGMMLEYGKTPFSCGVNTADSIPLILPPDTSLPPR